MISRGCSISSVKTVVLTGITELVVVVLVVDVIFFLFLFLFIQFYLSFSKFRAGLFLLKFCALSGRSLMPIAGLGLFASQEPKESIRTPKVQGPSSKLELPPTTSAAELIVITRVEVDAEAARGGAPHNQGEKGETLNER